MEGDESVAGKDTETEISEVRKGMRTEGMKGEVILENGREREREERGGRKKKKGTGIKWQQGLQKMNWSQWSGWK